MSTLRKTANDNGSWPSLVEFTCNSEVDDKKLADIKKAANAPSEDSADWVTVDGPAW